MIATWTEVRKTEKKFGKGYYLSGEGDNYHQLIHLLFRRNTTHKRKNSSCRLIRMTDERQN